jgi:hypothetical protein
MAEPNDSALREILARQRIHDALVRSCRGVDRLDADLIRSAYHSDALDDHGSFVGSVDDFIAWVMGNHGDGKIIACTHHLSNVLIVVEGNVAHCESYALVTHRRMFDGILCDMLTHGRYLDRFEERDGEWKIAHRFVIGDWDRIDPVERQLGGPLTDALRPSLRSRDDDSYRVLDLKYFVSGSA